jgi:hypothetical protein
MHLHACPPHVAVDDRSIECSVLVLELLQDLHAALSRASCFLAMLTVLALTTPTPMAAWRVIRVVACPGCMAGDPEGQDTCPTLPTASFDSFDGMYCRTWGHQAAYTLTEDECRL